MVTQEYGIGKSKTDYLIDQLATLGIVDIGIISGYSVKENRASIELFRTMGGRRQVITDAEMLTIGSNANGIWTDCVGAPCLVIYPRSTVVDIAKRLINPGKRPYDVAGVKCIPLSTRSNANFNLGFDSFGNFLIQTPSYTVTIDEQGITYANADNSDVKGIGTTNDTSMFGHVYKVTDEEHDELYYLDDSGKCAYRFIYKYDGTYTIQRAAYTAWTQEEKADRDSYENWTWETIWDNTGAMSETLKDADMNPLVSVSRTIDGGLVYTQTNADGDVLNNITISAEGDITIAQTAAENTISLLQDGTLTIETKDSIGITGHGGLAVDGDGGKVSIKNSSNDLKTILDTFADNLKNDMNTLKTALDAFQTAGSPASHVAVPGQLDTWKSTLDQNIDAFKSDVAGVFE